MAVASKATVFLNDRLDRDALRERSGLHGGVRDLVSFDSRGNVA